MKVGIGILGGGTVGGALLEYLINEQAAIVAKTGLELEVRRVAVRSLTKTRAFPIPVGMITDQPDQLIDDPSIDLVVEVMGGLEPAGDLVMRALQAGKPVVTANKELVAARGDELIRRAEEKGVSLLFEAAVGGAIPIIRPLSESLAGERITRVLGIVNGTTNYILTRMSDDNLGFAEAVEEAQALGYAEADPTADISGADSAAKTAILASLAFGTWISVEAVYREGIASLQPIDLRFAAELGYVPKLLAIGEETPNGVSARVYPALVPLDHPLASVRGASNAVFIEGPQVGELLFMGPGAGGGPTATAVLGDVIDAARELLAEAQVAPRIRFAPGRLTDFGEIETKWYVRLEVADAPGVLALIANAFGEAGVSIKSVWQEGRGEDATLLLITHDALETNQRAAVAALRSLDVVTEVAATIRVQSDEP